MSQSTTPSFKLSLRPLALCISLALTACGGAEMSSSSSTAAQPEAISGNSISGIGMPNPNPVVTRNWGDLPVGRNWGSTAGIDIDPTDGNVVAYERCGAGNFGSGVPVNCDTNPVDPIFKFDRNTGAVLANFGGGLMMTPHGIDVDAEGNVWVTDFAGNEEGTKGHQVHKFSPSGELLMSLGVPGQTGNDGAHFNQPNDVLVGPDGSIYVSDGHNGQGMITQEAIEEGRARGDTARVMKFAPDGTFIKQWGRIGLEHGEFRTPHAMDFDSKGRLWVVDRGNHRIEIFDQEGNYLESRYTYGRISGLFITGDDQVYAIDSESGPLNHPSWRNGVRIGHIDSDITHAMIPPFEREDRLYQGTAGEGVAVDADGNVFAAEGPNSLSQAGGAFTKYSVR
ncbi:MAG: peptidyl-alpha-hydroxyglycine alpha-amidating lyase family protein [Proteobacteria bacterium]|nr:peptidyl-alpha-hydroxyglycine alpha-amidating lyase family protein [Pseudomonadota bacterium]MDA0896665.1 peptidyl-alpha-hydroxyglycine alpha-amidating lyase family protein [Pseudomonadota bacterium]